MQINKKLIVFIALALVVCIGLIFYVNLPKPYYTIENSIEADEVDVAAKVPGRISKMLLEEGDSVKAKQIVAFMESKEIDAKLEQASGAFNASLSQQNQALYAYKTAKTTYERFKKLLQDGVISKQKADEIELQFLSAKSQYEAATYKVQATQGQVDEASSYEKETALRSPIDGYVTEKIVNQGSIIGAGSPVYTVVTNKDYKVKIFIDETKLWNIKIGNKYPIIIPALRNAIVYGEVLRISEAAEFATKKATNEQNSFDVKAFEVTLRIISGKENLRVGMTARVKLPNVR